MPSPTPAITARDIHKRYGSTVAVDGISFEVEVGEFFGILGPNGAGKTTTLEIVEGLRKPDSGEARVLGLPSWPRNPELLPLIGVQMQTSAFFERLTATEQIHTLARLYGVPPRHGDELLEQFGLGHRARTRVDHLSGGEAQRLSIACALVHDPRVLFLDEPTAGLDPQARRNLWDLVREINAAGRTVVLTTHYIEEAEVLCDRVAIVDRGRILECDRPEALIRKVDAVSRITVQTGRIDVEDLRKRLPEVSVQEDEDSLVIATREPGSVLGVLAELGALRDLTVRGATLEDAFLTLTGREYRS
ncbi:ABC transporter ATP-binding protein [Streptomyces sp. WI04-05B]|uniref:ABC transporter ATP-binding protein n=1 Tax=Streptomyces TaxID=1883 RepID=UPI0029BAA29A|nr:MULTISPECIES: ABC transporter ATP-binding protein [unclassified Streptomyces]MDX2545387.1 ABC transporter ATP-binding protein [Streptomyces sp. WI04-05B]MDX2588118.1 ABC transporter ATP-binding protein [Streptomyces sp. WI04-05A]MDX3749121.1 ABC transporter ATP-binding protein [Streptomyces sp. AK08-02]